MLCGMGSAWRMPAVGLPDLIEYDPLRTPVHHYFVTPGAVPDLLQLRGREVFSLLFVHQLVGLPEMLGQA
jgi:hypothetical protein